MNHRSINIKIIAIFTIALLLSTLLAFPKDTIVASSLERENVVVFVHFSDQTPNTETPEFYKEIDGKFNTGGENGEYGISFKEYMEKISYGQIKIKNIFPQQTEVDGEIILTSMKLDRTRDSLFGVENKTVYIVDEVADILNENPQNYDVNGNGRIDNFTIVMQGDAYDDDGNRIETVWPHQHNYTGSRKLGTSEISEVTVLNTDRLVGLLASGVSLIAHEYLHGLNYPDLYTKGEVHNPLNGRPVGEWGIMGMATHNPQYPLAILRDHYTGWIDIETITSAENKTFVIDTAENQHGNQAYMFKSPLNDYEVFVVEYRKKTSDPKGIDTGIPDSGVIVYRVDTRVEDLSNDKGEFGIYIFRPWDELQTNQNLMKANLSLESGRTSIGSADLNDGIEDGALTYSDGTNSGIVISNVGSAAGDTISLNVTIPKEESFDLWKDENYNNSNVEGTSKGVTSINIGETQYVMTFGNNKYKLSSFNGTSWDYSHGEFSASGDSATTMELFEWNGSLYFANVAYDKDYNADIQIRKYNNTTKEWELKKTLHSKATGGSFGIEVLGDKVYIAYAETVSGKDNAVLTSLVEDGGSVNEIEIGQYKVGSQYTFGQPEVVAYNNEIYTLIRSSGDVIDIYKLNAASNTFAEITTNTGSDGHIVANSFDVKAYNDKLYILCGDTTSRIFTYDGSVWKEGEPVGISSFEPKLAVTQGNLYCLSVTNGGEEDGTTTVYRYYDALGKWIKEGHNAETIKSEKLNLTSSNDKIYLTYVKEVNGNDQIAVKSKIHANKLTDIKITKPITKTVYNVGDEIDYSGLEVTAYYEDGTEKVLTKNEYELVGFDTTTPGKRTCKILVAGKEASFSYEVLTDKEVPYIDFEPDRYAEATRNQYLKSDLGYDNENLAIVRTGEEITIHGAYKADGYYWYYVTWNGKKGYLTSKYVKNIYFDYSPDREGNPTQDIELKKGIGNSFATIDTIKSGEKITIYGTYSTVGWNWFKVGYNGNIGYVDSEFIELIYNDYEPDRTAEAKKNQYLKAGVGYNFKNLGIVRTGDKLTIHGSYEVEGTNWCKVTWNGKTGYLSLANLRLVYYDYSPDRYAEATKLQELRSGIGYNYTSLGTINPGETVLIDRSYEVEGVNWGRVTWNGITGYISLGDAKLIYNDYEPDRTAEAKKNQYLKAGVGYNFKNLGIVRTGDKLTIHGSYEVEGTNWCKVTWNGKTGYLSLANLRLVYYDYSPDRYAEATKLQELRSGIGYNYTSLGTINPGETVLIDRSYEVEGVNWGRVTWNGITGFISLGDAKWAYNAFEPTEIAKANKNQYIRAGVGYNFNAIGIIRAGENVIVHGIYDMEGTDWYKVTWKGKTGYIPLSGVTLI